VTNTETGWTRTIPTNDSGQYVVPNIQIGHYSVKAEASGFKVAEQKDVVLSVGDRLRLDFQMRWHLGGNRYRRSESYRRTNPIPASSATSLPTKQVPTCSERPQ